MKKYSFQMTKEEVRELILREIWEQLLLHRVKCLLLLAVLVLEDIFVSWIVSLVTVIWLLAFFVIFIVRKNHAAKDLCKKTQTMEVEDGMLKQGTEGELYREIPCCSITEVKTTRHLLMLGICQASKSVKWFPVPLRVFADRQERDRFVESVRNPQTAEESGTSSAKDCGASKAEKSEQEYFHLSSQVGEEEWVRILTAATANSQAGSPERQKRLHASIIFAVSSTVFVVFSILGIQIVQRIPGVADIMYAIIFVGTIIYLIMLRNLLENPEKRIRTQIHRGNVQNNVQGVWKTSVTEMGIRQSISGEKSTMIPWESLACVVETDTDLIFYQKGQRLFCGLPKEGMESLEQIESLKGLCWEKHVEVLVGKRKKYVPNWFFPLVLAVVIVGYAVAYVWLVH